MRLVTYRKGSLVGVGVRTDGGVIPTRYLDMVTLIEDGDRGLEHARETAALGDGSAIEPDRILAPVLRPQKIFGCGPNFLKHLEEDPDATLTDEQFFFSKLPSAIVGPGDPIEIARDDLQLDWEVELGVVIGKTARYVTSEQAPDHVFGYTLIHDVSSRWIQLKDNQITLGKNLDTFCPMGPDLVTKDQIPDPHSLRMWTTVNGEVMQEESTSAMRYTFAELVSYLSEIVTLVPGDIITSGTPDGIGCFREPPIYLKAGDTVTIGADGVGELTNPVVRAERTLSDRYFFRQK